MALWDKLSSKGTVVDRRGLGNTARVGGGLGIVGIVLIVLVNYLGGGDVGDVLNQLNQAQVLPQENINSADFAGSDEYEVFIATVLGSVNDMWAETFAKNNINYTPPTLVLFRGGTESACGGAVSQSGPHYCPLDQTIYLDETFFEELQRQFGGSSGDVAQAYVIAHEVGHHVQHILNNLDSTRTNEESIKTELQADCYAGLWAYSIKDRGIFEVDEIKEALDAAATVGDDHIQKTTTGRVNPESWTHGSSAERVSWFTRGYDTGTVASCQ